MENHQDAEGGAEPEEAVPRWAPVPRAYRFVFERSPRTTPSSYEGRRIVRIDWHPRLRGTWRTDPENILYWSYSATRARARVTHTREGDN